ncbi:MAG TPA: hypothetical protein VFX45_02150 [Solirubrobacterales bacterium]|nr:hypothetical protein [Solirubrobacterales bacterium]
MSRLSKCTGTLLATVVWLGCLIVPQAGLAKVSCERDPQGSVLSISVTERTRAIVRRAGDAITVFEFANPARGCQAGATIANTDRIELFAGEDTGVHIELAKGPFAPGLTPEADGSPEIEFEISGEGLVEVVGPPGPDHYRFTGAGTESGVNLNPADDEDPDLTVPPEARAGIIFVVSGGAGADRIDALGRPALEMFAVGGRGDDTLVAAPGGAILGGEAGSDLLIGSPTLDFIVPGKGADVVRAGGGPDEVVLNRDGARDRVDCGSGNDFAFGADRLDRLRSCR